MDSTNIGAGVEAGDEALEPVTGALRLRWTAVGLGVGWIGRHNAGDAVGGELAVGAGCMVGAGAGAAVLHPWAPGASAAGSWALAPMLSGPDRRTLSLLSAETTAAGFDQGHAVGFIKTLRVETAGTGLP